MEPKKVDYYTEFRVDDATFDYVVQQGLNNLAKFEQTHQSKDVPDTVFNCLSDCMISAITMRRGGVSKQFNTLCPLSVLKIFMRQ